MRPRLRAALVRLSSDRHDLPRDRFRLIARQEEDGVHDLFELDEGVLGSGCMVATLSRSARVAGATAFTRMLASRYSRASSRVRPATADLAALYADMCMSERTTAIDAKLTIEPPALPRDSKHGDRRLTCEKAVLKLTANSRSRDIGLHSVNGP